MTEVCRQSRWMLQAAALGTTLVLALSLSAGAVAGAANAKAVRHSGVAPTFAGKGDARLAAVKAFSPSDVWIAGAHESSRFPETPVIRHFDGATWTRMGSLPHPHGDWCFPSAIDGLADDDMWVACRNVGYRLPDPPLVAHWDGKTWQLQDIADVEGVDDLVGLWVDTPRDIWAVGNHRPASVLYPLVEHFDGHVWKRMRVETPPDTQLRSVSGTSPHDVWAVGYSSNGGYQRSVTLHYDGRRWSLVESLPPPTVAALESVVAIAPDDVWAVGIYAGQNNDENPRGLLLHWDGQEWVDVRTDAVEEFDYLFGVTALSGDDVWVVGTDAEVSPRRTLAFHWDGVSWTPVPPQNVGEHDSLLTSVSADAHGDVWAAGWWWSGKRTVRMYQHWDGTAWSRHVP